MECRLPLRQNSGKAIMESTELTLQHAQDSVKKAENDFGTESRQHAEALLSFAKLLRERKERPLDAANFEAKAKLICTKLSLDPSDLGYRKPLSMDRINSLIAAREYPKAFEESKKQLANLLSESNLIFEDIIKVLDAMEKTLRLDGRKLLADTISRSSTMARLGTSESSKIEAIVNILPILGLDRTTLNECFSQPSSKDGAYLCRCCGFVGVPRKARRGNGALEFILWWFFLLPGLIYSIWRSGNYIKLCPTCDKSDLIPAFSQVAKAQLASVPATSSQGVVDDYRECPFCAEQVRVKAIKCKHCGSDIATS